MKTTKPTHFGRFFSLASILALSSAGAQFAVQGPTLQLNGVVFAVESQADGRVFLGGSYNGFNGGTGRGLMRLNSDGSEDQSLDIHHVGNVRDLLVLGDHLYVAGEFGSVSTKSAGVLTLPYLFRINLTGPSEGKVDPAWQPAPNGPVIHLESDGSDLFAAGKFSSLGGAARARLAKIRTSNAADPDAADATWNPGADGEVEDLEVQGAWLYVCGYFANVGGLNQDYVARLSVAGAGAADPTWTPTTDRPVTRLESDATHVYLGGHYEVANGMSRKALVRFDISGPGEVMDSGWYPALDGEPGALLRDGAHLYVSGVFTHVGATERFFLAKLSTSGGGSLDGAFAPDPSGAVLDMKMVAGGLLVGGRFTTTLGAFSGAFAKLDPGTGAASAGFAGTITSQGSIVSILPLAGGGMMIGGTFDAVNGVTRPGVARLNPDGTLDPSFDAHLFGYNPVVKDMKVDGGMLYMAGDFQRAAGGARQHLARANLATGAVDTGWSPNAYTPLSCIETDATHIYVGAAGLFAVNDTSVFNLARVAKAGGGTDPSWLPMVTLGGNPNTASVLDMVFDADKLIICGYFTFIVHPSDPNNPANQYLRVCLAELETTGPDSSRPTAGWDEQFLKGSPSDPDVAAVEQVLLHNGSLYVAGDFVWAGGEGQYYVAKMDPQDGSYDNGFFVAPLEQDDPYGDDNVKAIAAHGSHIYVAGDYQQVRDAGYNLDDWPYLARVDQDSGLYDPSWYAYPDRPVDVLAFQGDDLWIYGRYFSLLYEELSGVAILRPYPTAYQNWLAAHLPAWQLGYADYTATFWDDDYDGLTNFEEFAFRMNPRSGQRPRMAPGTGTSGLPAIRPEIIGGQRYLVTEFVRWKDSANAGVQYEPVFSDSLEQGSWTGRGVPVSTVPIDTESERVKVRDSLGNLPRAFATVRVSPSGP